MAAHRLAGLDQLRGIAVLGVVLHHASWSHNGFIGVDVFFVLSGYLITSLLTVEVSSTGRLDLARFSARRLLRLYPALLVAVAFVVAVSLVTRETVAGTLSDALSALTYTGNFHDFHGLLDHTWTLALEEQFYLVWPAVLWMSYRGGRFRPWLATLLLGGILLLDLATGRDGNAHGYVRAGGLAVGCALALSPRLTERIRPFGWPAVLGLVAFMALPVSQNWFTSWPISLAAVLAAPAIARFRSETLVSGRSGDAMRWLGLRSYSLYLWHFPLLALALHHSPVSLPAVFLKILAIGGALAVSEVSYRLVELPVLAWRQRRLPAASSKA